MHFFEETPEQQKFLPELHFSKEEWEAFPPEQQHDFAVTQWHLLRDVDWQEKYAQSDLPYSELLRSFILSLSGSADPLPGISLGVRTNLVDSGVVEGFDDGQLNLADDVISNAFDRYFVRDVARSGTPSYEPNKERFNDSSFGDTLALIRTTILSGVQQIREHRDPLTNALNRRHGLPLLDDSIARYRSGERHNPSSVCFIDIDLFKLINDTHGHGVGDAILAGVVRRAAQVLHRYYHPDSVSEEPSFPIIRTGRGSVSLNVPKPSRRFDNSNHPPEHPVVRYGGEEFLALMPDVDFIQSTEIAEAIRAALAAIPFYIVSDPDAPGKMLAVDAPPVDSGLLHKIVPVTASFGLAQLVDSDLTAADLLTRADQCLYVAKGKPGFVEKLEADGHRVSCAPDMSLEETRNRVVTFEGHNIVVQNRGRAAA